MRLTFVGTTSDRTNCPAVFVTDRGTYGVQARKITDQGARDDAAAEVGLAPDEELVELEPALVEILLQAHRTRQGS